MCRGIRFVIIFALALVIIGLAVFALAMSFNQWDFNKLSTVEYETRTFEFKAPFENVEIETDTADVVFKPSADRRCCVECYERKDSNHMAEVKNGTLSIRLEDKTKWYENFDIVSGTPKITVYLPVNAYKTLQITGSTGDVELPEAFRFERITVSTDTGDVKVQGISAGAVKLESDTGKIRLESLTVETVDILTDTGNIVLSSIDCRNLVEIETDTGEIRLTAVRCKSLSVEGDTGDCYLQDIIAETRLEAELSTGSVLLEACDAGELLIETDTGNVRGSLLSEKVFIVESNHGSVDVPKTITGGRCEVETDTGDIQLEIQ